MTISLTTRFAILKRDRFTCVYCGAHPPQVQIEVDHYFPLARGGTDDFGNLVTACYECNHGKRDNLIENDPWPGDDSPLWKWIILGSDQENRRLQRLFLDREPELTLADVVEQVWPEADF